jgi:MoaA/NifB/PqqE/SkfB family radical SAM enzyme
MLSAPSQAAFKLARRRYRQVLFNVPRFLHEVSRVRSPLELYKWLYFKLPYTLPRSDFPVMINLEPTNECNLRCPHCPRLLAVKQRGMGLMDSALFRKIVSEIARHLPCTLKIVGLGEPALHSEFSILMDEVTAHQVPTIVYTNGTLLGRYSTAQIARWRIRTIVISIDGIDPVSFAKTRVGGDYEELKRLTRRFHAERPSAGPLQPELEIRHVIFPNETAADLLKFRQEWLQFADKVTFNYLYHPATPSEIVRTTRCRDIRREFYIYWDGRVPLCGYQYLANANEWLGDIRHSSIAELWHHPRLREVREAHLKRDLCALPFCKTCTFK